MWIVVPPFGVPALIAADVAIEWSPYLFVLDALVLILLLRARTRQRWVAAGLTIVNAGLCAIPSVALLVAQGGAGTLSGSNHRVPGIVSERAIRIRFSDFVPTIREYQPPHANECPAIVFAIYGGAWQRGSSSNDARLNRALAARGYEVFALDYRHAPAFHFPAQLIDVGREIDWVTQQPARRRCGPPRIALLGHSSGGELALLAAFTRPNVAAVVSYSGPIDLDQAYRFPPRPDPLDVRAILRAYLGATPTSAREAYRAASPLMHVRVHLPATLLIYGERDHVVDVRAPVELRDALQARGDDVTLLRLPWAEHAFENVPLGLHGRFALNAVDAFFSRTLARNERS
jgi:acetyl esterase/lipase